MSIRFSKYININSVVGGAAQVPTRLWGPRVFTTNPLVGPTSILQFPDAASVGAFFGTSSTAYARAVSYFAYQSPLGVAPTPIQFARWAKTAQPATIFGEANAAVLASLIAVASGSISFKFGSTTVNVTGISLTTQTTLTGVASAIQTALVAAASQAPNGELATATVTWNSTAQAFDFTASNTGVVTETFQVVAPTTGTDLSALLGWYASQGALVNSASAVETPDAAFSRVMAANNNCGEFMYSIDAALTLAQVTTIAQLNVGLNVMFIFRVLVGPTTWSTWSAALLAIAGVGLEYEDTSVTGAEQYFDMMGPSIHAAIDYTAQNGAVGFMYKQCSAYTASINDNPGTVQSDALDAARVNYYGVTQTAGQNISFYQRGVLCGGATAPVDSTVFANEQWFKDEVASQLMNLQLSVGQIPANKRGQTMCENIIQGQTAANGNQPTGIEAALYNGVISANSSLTMAQQIYITNQSGDSTAWQQVQSIGYWKTTNITSAVATSGVTEYTLNYIIIYRKDDVIKTITGSHQLI